MLMHLLECGSSTTGLLFLQRHSKVVVLFSHSLELYMIKRPLLFFVTTKLLIDYRHFIDLNVSLSIKLIGCKF